MSGSPPRGLRRTTRPPPPDRGLGGTTPPPGSARPPLIELERNRFMIVRYLEPARVVILVRLPEDYPGTEDLRWAFERLRRALDGVPRHRASLLIDSRQAPARNDPEFERVFAPLRADLMRGFSRVALVVRSAVGVLQVTRHARIDGIDAGVFTDPAEALVSVGGPADERLLAIEPIG